MKVIIIKNKNSSYEINDKENILQRQIRLLNKFVINDIITKAKILSELIINLINKENEIIILNGAAVFSEAILNDILASENNICVSDTYQKSSYKNKKTKINFKSISNDYLNTFPLIKIKSKNDNLANIYKAKNEFCSIFNNDKKLEYIKNNLNKNKVVYLAFSTDIIHGGHIRILKKSSELGKVIVGVMSDQAVASFKRYPVLDYEHRYEIIKNIKYVDKVVEQKSLSYKDNLKNIKPDYVVHGDEWKNDNLKYIREETLNVLKEIGGKLIEYPFSTDKEFSVLEYKSAEYLSIPEVRRGRLKKYYLINR